MANYDSNYAIAQEISARIGTKPVPFDSVYSICLAIYQELGGTEENFDSVYSILLEILPLVEGGVASKVIDDSVITTVKTWSSSKINSELSGKQNTISDLSDIRSGATLGATAVQPSALTDYATTSALTSGLSTKQDVLTSGSGVTIDSANTISVSSEVISGAALGATALQSVPSEYVTETELSTELADYATTSALTVGLSSKQDTLVAGSGITISGNTISATGGDAIEDVNALPDAGENKNKLVRLSTDDNVYVSELKSRTSTTTNRLPDAQQIDKAYLYEASTDIYYYKGAYTVIFDDTEINGYGWLEDLGEGGWYFILTEVDAEHIQSNSIAYGFLADEDADVIDLVNKTVTTNKVSTNFKFTLEDVLGTLEIPIPATYNAPEANQIGNAKFDTDGDTLVYDGTETTITVDGNILTVYTWQGVDDTEWYLYSTKPASEIYFQQEEFNFYSDVVFYYDDGDTLDEIWNMYIPQLNAPDSEQVNNAYFVYDDVYSYYKGAIEAHFTDGTLTLYRWERTDIYNYFTKYSANQQYDESTIKYGDSEDGLMLYYNSEQSGWYSDDLTVSQAEATMNQVVLPDYIESYSTVKYQRTVVTEEWDWQPLTDNATNDDIDLMFANEIKLIRYQDAEQQAEGFQDWWVNTNGETMEYDGQTYYKWVSWTNDETEGADEPTEHSDYVMLTNTLFVSLPFNTDSPEFEYTITYDSEGDTWSDANYFHGDYTQMTVQ